jgi:hypothetical protein
MAYLWPYIRHGRRVFDRQAPNFHVDLIPLIMDIGRCEFGVAMPSYRQVAKSDHDQVRRID